MKRKWSVTLGIALVLILQLSCRGPGSSKPPHYGAFLRTGKRFVEMEQFGGGPKDLDSEGIPEASDSQPMIVLWYPEANVSDLLLRQALGRGQPIQYDVSPQHEGILEIRSKDPLDPGVYCLVQGHPLKSPVEIPYWCFRVGGDGGSPGKGSEASGPGGAAVDCAAVQTRIRAGDYSDIVPGANLAGCDLSELNLIEVDLSGADLSMADMQRADLTKAKLAGANLRGANLQMAKLAGADLSNADLGGAYLMLENYSLGSSPSTIGAEFEGVTLQDAVVVFSYLSSDAALAWSPNSERIAYTERDQCAIRFLDTLAVQTDPGASFDQAQVCAGSQISWSPSGDYLAVDEGDWRNRQRAAVHILDASTGVLKISKDSFQLGSVGSAWSPDGKRLASGDRETTQIWDVETGATLTTLESGLDTTAFTSVLWSPDGSLLATVGTDKVVRVWEVDTAETLSVLRHSERVFSITWSPDSTRLASASGSVAQVWDVQSGSMSHTFEGDRLYDVAWNPNGEMLVVVDSSGMRLYDSKTGSVLASMKPRNQGLDRGWVGVGRVAWKPDGSRLAAYGGRLALWPTAVLVPQ